MPKTNKSILKRIKLTPGGKLIRRRAGHNHFNAKASRRSQRRGRAIVEFPASFARNLASRM
ncbi:50S ribosomal protein L35 [Candidatus Parcubacteria bacterium]|nr:MAG: 50S ribosomal protein L35 [Candidatus Parcubacteria bacterium]